MDKLALFFIAIGHAMLLFIGVLTIIGSFIISNRKQKCILVDFDSLVDIKPIKEREVIYYKNHPEELSDRLKYMVAHISEQKVIAAQILKCRLWQGMGYKMIYVSERDERLRIQTAKVLNEWELKGELYCCGTLYDKEIAMHDIIENWNVIGVITNPDENGRVLAEIALKSKRL